MLITLCKVFLQEEHTKSTSVYSISPVNASLKYYQGEIIFPLVIQS